MISSLFQFRYSIGIEEQEHIQHNMKMHSALKVIVLTVFIYISSYYKNLYGGFL